MKTFSQQLRTARYAKRLTYDQLVEITDLSKSYLWQLENHPQSNPSIRTVKILATALGTSIDFLIDTEGTIPYDSSLDKAFITAYLEAPQPLKNQIREIATTLGLRETQHEVN